MFKRKTKLFIFLAILFLPIALYAAEEIQKPKGFLDNIACINGGICGLDDIAMGFVELINLLLGLMGSVALVYFVWGGIVWITSGGNMEKIGKGRNIMINTILAILVSFSSFIILSFFTKDLLGVGTKFEVTAPCSTANTEDDTRYATRCKEGEPYYCYKGACLSKCEIANRKILAMPASNAIPPVPVNTIKIQPEGKTFQRGDSLACERISPQVPPRAVGNFPNYCPGNDADLVCVFRRRGTIQPALP